MTSYVDAAERTNQHARNFSIAPIPVKVGIMQSGLLGRGSGRFVLGKRLMLVSQ
ncbi:hypothetical protein AVEN_119921-1, partial [Araneus ventricosus]